MVYYDSDTVASVSRIRIDPSSPVPIWSQIEEAVRRLVASGGWAPGDAVPSVRQCATDLRINPATVAKAYQRLVDAGVLEMRRGDGTYVADRPPATTRTQRARDLSVAAERFVTIALPMGTSLEQGLDAVRSAWADLSRASRREKSA
jgi:GntR family transcriptional regulator